MKDTLEIECLVQSLFSAVAASKTEAEKRDEHQGYSWDYWGSSYIQDKNDAMEDFGKRLESYIDKRVEDALIRRALEG